MKVDALMRESTLSEPREYLLLHQFHENPGDLVAYFFEGEVEVVATKQKLSTNQFSTKWSTVFAAYYGENIEKDIVYIWFSAQHHDNERRHIVYNSGIKDGKWGIAKRLLAVVNIINTYLLEKEQIRNADIKKNWKKYVGEDGGYKKD